MVRERWIDLSLHSLTLIGAPYTPGEACLLMDLLPLDAIFSAQFAGLFIYGSLI
jgi:hypothetical protein